MWFGVVFFQLESSGRQASRSSSTQDRSAERCHFHQVRLIYQCRFVQLCQSNVISNGVSVDGCGMGCRFVCSNTLEEFIHLRALYKLQMTGNILQQGRFTAADSSTDPTTQSSNGFSKSDPKDLKLNHMLSFGLDKLFEESNDLESAASESL